MTIEYKPVNTANKLLQALKKMNTITLVLPDNRQTRAFIKMATSFLKQAKVSKKQTIKVALKPAAPVVEPFTIAEPVAVQVVEPIVEPVAEPVVVIDEEKEVEKIMTLPAHVQPLALANLARRLPKAATPEVDISNRKPIIIGRRTLPKKHWSIRDDTQAEPEAEHSQELIQAVREEIALEEARLDGLVVNAVDKEEAKLDILRAEHRAYIEAINKEDAEHLNTIREEEAEHLNTINMAYEDMRAARVENLYTEEQVLADIPDWDSPTDLTKYANRVPKDDVSQKFALDKCPLYKLRHLWNKKPTHAGKTYKLDIEIDGTVYESYGVARAFKGSDTVGFVKLTWRTT